MEENWTESDEKRLEVIGQNSNDGDHYKELKKRFKDKMNGLKLNKKIDLDQAKAIVYALEKYPDFCDCLYVKTTKLDEGKFNKFWDVLPPNIRARSNKKKTKIEFAKKQNKFNDIMDGLRNKLIYSSRCRKAGVFAPELPAMERWLRDDRFYDEIPKHPEKSTNQGFAVEVKERDPAIVKAEQDKKTKCVNIDFARKFLTTKKVD